MSHAAPTATSADAPNAEDLARLIRDGLEASRWPLVPPNRPAPPSPPEPAEIRLTLLPFSSQLGHAATAKPGPLGKPIRFIRRAIKFFLRPWFDLQTRFNHTVIDTLEADNRKLSAHLRELTGYLRDQQETIRRLTLRVNDCFHLARTHRDELRDELTRDIERRMIQLSAESGEPADVAGSVHVSAGVLEQVFVHTRLPAPPARLLELGGGSIELAGLGFHVVGVDRWRPAEEFGNLRLVRAEPPKLPFPDGSFDVAVHRTALSAAGDEFGNLDEVHRVLRSGGRLLLTLPFGHPAGEGAKPHDEPTIDRMLAKFRRVESAFGVRGAGGWAFTTDATAAGRSAAMALLVAEKV
jgi:hypothetical protein